VHSLQQSKKPQLPVLLVTYAIAMQFN